MLLDGRLSSRDKDALGLAERRIAGSIGAERNDWEPATCVDASLADLSGRGFDSRRLHQSIKSGVPPPSLRSIAPLIPLIFPRQGCLGRSKSDPRPLSIQA